MQKFIIAVVFLLSATMLSSYAQDKAELDAYLRTEKNLMLKAYAARNIPDYVTHLDNITGRYKESTGKEKDFIESFYVLNGYYMLACLYSMEGDHSAAIYYLKKSENYDYGELTDDHDLDNLRGDRRFDAILDSAKHREAHFLYTLQNAPQYGASDESNFPAFTYQTANDPNLVALKNTYNLDSVAGKGSDVARVINLMEWVHYLIPHNGAKGNPDTKNAMSLINECRKDGKTLNCRGLAIVLNEVYLAEGYKSRFVTCLPKDSTDQDCHVITIVWIPSLNKWVWMDPTFMAYVMDERGNLLGIEEVRERLIHNRTLILNPDANRNHTSSQKKADYLERYMAKNLYKLECPIHSEYNYETKEDGKQAEYVQLLPGSYPPATATPKNQHGITSYTRYYTTSPDAFWAAPKSTAVTHAINDYIQAMDIFRTNYNRSDAAAIRNMFSDDWGEMKKYVWREDQNNQLISDYGKLRSFKYIGRSNEQDRVVLFEATFDKSVHVMGIALDDKNKLETFRFNTTSPYIDKLLAREL